MSFVVKELLASTLCNWLAQASVAGQLGSLVRGFPGEVGIATAKVSVSRSLTVDRAAQLQRVDNAFRGHMEIGSHQIGNCIGIHLAGTERVNQYAHRFGYADGVGELDLAAVGQAGSHDILGNVPRHVGRRAVDLGRILAAEGAAAVTSHAAVGVHDNLASGKTGVAHGAADHETSGGIDVVLGIFVEQLGGDGGLDDVLQNVASEFFVADCLCVLSGNDDCVHTDGLVVLVVFNRDLRFAIGAQVRKAPMLANICESHGQLVRK